MIELYSCGILKEVFKGRGEGKKVIWNPAVRHLWKGVVNKAGIQASDKGP